MSPQDPGELRQLSPSDLRREFRLGRSAGLTAGLASGYIQANLVILPSRVGEDFEAFCLANAASLPLIERGRPGDPILASGNEFDVRTDLPKYRVWRDGRRAELVTDIRALWTDESMAFLLGCWFSNEDALARAGIRLRHIELGIQGALFRTNLEAIPVGRFAGPVVASMRPFATKDVDRVANITARMPSAHGAPLWIGDPASLGIFDLATPDFGEQILPQPDETPMFWACGLTGQEALAASGIPLFITHEPGHMAVTDIPVESSP